VFTHFSGQPLTSVGPSFVFAQLKGRGVLAFRGSGATLDDAVCFTRALGVIVTTVEVTGTRYVGLHGELTYTPFPPDLLCFYCETPPESAGGETMLCDGVAVAAVLSTGLRHLLGERKLQIRSRWSADYLAKRYSAQSKSDLIRKLSEIPGLEIDDDGDVWSLTLVRSALIRTRFSNEAAFVNSILIALHDQRERPERAYTLTLDNGDPFPASALDEILEVTGRLTYPFRWEAGDYLIVDNSRMLHGRTACANVNGSRRLINMHTNVNPLIREQ
jgi:hypothetical protein